MFYEYRQNNSGGGFVFAKTSGISVYVIVEANSLDEANERAEGIGLYFDGVDNGHDCSCCGDRWSEPWKRGTERPEISGKPVDLFQPTYGKWAPEGFPEVFVHFRNGLVEGYATEAPQR